MLRDFFESAVIALASMLGPLLAHQAITQQSPETILAFDSMHGVEASFLHHKLRGIRGADLPREVESATGSLDSSGQITIDVRGLVLANTPAVPAALRGINDAAVFRAAVSCLTAEDGKPARAIVVTEGFPATERGDANINDQIMLPTPCFAPVVFLLPGDEKLWFAATGMI